MTKPFFKRWLTVVVTVISFLALTVLVIRKGVYNDEAPVGKYIHWKNFEWLDLENRSTFKKCRNSVQGPSFLADEKGYICSHGDLSVNGCCIPERNSTERFSCSTCQENRCCKIYEHCVSCCLQPDKRHLLENVLAKARNSRSPLLRIVKDTFELCLAKCRTSSSSVQQENVYRDNTYKFCYGLDPPTLQVRR
ncbi:SREBP regulating gene protein-like [Rhopilema esculentum]|uniref:SREBP regulating gene protein-like n=1 Tax=Rhopilema esculentum TaxID=499914 RepID=UPI0031D645C9